MTYFRLRDIKTPPFAYAVNKERVVRACRVCEMPFRELTGALEIEIITSDHDDWVSELRGRPLLADHWLIGDDAVVAALERVLGGLFRRVPVRVASRLTSASLLDSRSRGDDYGAMEGGYYFLEPRHTIAVEGSMIERFPPIRCHACHREIPDLPFDLQPLPDLSRDDKPVVALQDFFMEGYGYLFHETIAEDLSHLFPEMILEKVVAETLYI